VIVAMAADDVTNVNLGIKQFITAVGFMQQQILYDHGHWTTFQ